MTQEVKGKVVIDINKQYRTLDGREVKLLMTDAGGNYPIIGAIKNHEGSWFGFQWTPNGNRGCDSNSELVEVKPKHVRWINIYKQIGFDETREIADKAAAAATLAGRCRIACLRIEFEEGEGL